MRPACTASLAEHLWGRDTTDGQTWELMFYFAPPTVVDLTTDQVRASLGYDATWWPQGLQYPTPDHQEALLEKYGTVEAFVRSASDGGASHDGEVPEPAVLM